MIVPLPPNMSPGPTSSTPNNGGTYGMGWWGEIRGLRCETTDGRSCEKMKVPQQAERKWGEEKTEWKNPARKIGISSVGWKNPGASLLSGKQLKSFTPNVFVHPKVLKVFGTLDPGSRTKNPLEKPEKVASPSANHVSKRPYQKPSGRPSKPALMALSEAFRRILHNHPAEHFGRQIHSL